MKQQLFILSIFFGLASCSNSTSDKHKADRQSELKSDSLLENKFERLTRIALVDSAITFRLDTLANFSWDTLIIIQPYYPIDTLEARTNTNLSAIVETAIMNDGENVLAFVKGGQLINYVRLPRDKGDFCSIHDNIVFSKDSCIFEFVRTPNIFPSGQNVVEAKIKR